MYIYKILEEEALNWLVHHNQTQIASDNHNCIVEREPVWLGQLCRGSCVWVKEQNLLLLIQQILSN